ncbi:MAG: TonB C-terminal domain-containing protein [Alphaproteobacteria bacterium]|nr:TonB C-terminal domain-containing protein [Alphaproteobacteria bacterium]
MERGAIYSAILHVAVILFAWFGLPQLTIAPPEPDRPIIVELAEIGDITNPPPAPQLQQGEKEPEPPKPEPPKPEPAKPEPPKPAPPPPPPPPKPAEPAPPPEPAPMPKEKAPEPKKPEADKPSPLAEVKPKKKPEPPPDDFIKNVLKSVDKAKPQQQADDFEKTLKKLADSSPKKDDKPQPPAQPAKAQAGSPASNLNDKFTLTETDFIRAYIQKNWNPPVGAKDVVVVVVSFTMRPDGTFYDLRYENQKSGDTLWQSFADSARRALLLSQPIPLPPGKIRTDERFVLNFDPREMMGFSKGR